MKRISLALTAVAICLASCQSNSSTTTLDEPLAQTDSLEVSSTEPTSYGDALAKGEAMPVATALELLNNKDSVMVKMEGIALTSCKMKGCWMTLAAPDSAEVRVTFKDYGFFVPKDLNGERVVVEGILKKETISVADQQHFAKDAGKSADEIAAITTEAYKPTFVATGVLVYPQQ